MNPQEASALLAYARQHDHLVLNTDPAANTWINSLAHVPVEAGRALVEEYYGRHREPEKRKPIDASIIRQLYRSKSTEHAARDRALAPPPPRKGGGPPPHVKTKLNAFYDRVGYTPKERRP